MCCCWIINFRFYFLIIFLDSWNMQILQQCDTHIYRKLSEKNFVSSCTSNLSCALSLLKQVRYLECTVLTSQLNQKSQDIQYMNAWRADVLPRWSFRITENRIISKAMVRLHCPPTTPTPPSINQVSRQIYAI